MANEIVQRGIVARMLSNFGAQGDGSQSNAAGMRLGRYNEGYALSLFPTKHLLADEGSYFIGTNPTPGTALAYNIQASFSDTVPFIYLANTDTVKRAYLDYIKIIVTTAAATGTQAYYAIKTDRAARALSANNTATIVPVSPNSDIANASVCTLNAQNNGTASAIGGASAAARVVARGSFGGLTIIGDELAIVCGSADPGSYAGLTAAQATCPGRKCSVSPPIVVGPGANLTVHLWFPGNATTGLSYEFEMGWAER
jgi:hypothetical protein